MYLITDNLVQGGGSGKIENTMVFLKVLLGVLV